MKDYRNAILLALSMDQPRRLLTLFQQVSASRVGPPPGSLLIALTATTPIEESASITGDVNVDMVIKGLTGADLARLLRYVRDWNSRARTSPTAQTILHAILRFHTADIIVAAFELQSDAPRAGSPEKEDEEDYADKKKQNVVAPLALKDLLEALMPYTERHFAKANRLVQESFLLDFVLSEGGELLGDDLMDVDSSNNRAVYR